MVVQGVRHAAAATAVEIEIVACQAGLAVGLAYFGAFKLTDDQFDSRLASRLIRDKNRLWGLGPDITLALAVTKQADDGFVNVRYEWGSGPERQPRGRR